MNRSISIGNKSFAARLLMLFLCLALSVSVFYQNGTVAANETELRGVWISTVANIDYPSKGTTDSATLKAEMDTILDHCKAMGFNAVFFQVRPCGDAFYNSAIFPWSRYLTGTQGVAPSDGFDPLAYAIEGAHSRGMQLHAWINPYRITNASSDNSRLSANNPAVQNPALVLTDSNGKMYYNPGDAASVELIVQGAEEIVKNYDVDGLHMDDYFYPDASFNDNGTYSYFKDQFPDKNAWRRHNVDTLVKTLDERLHAIKPEIQFGISPRGIWANKSDMAEGSDTAGGGSYNSIHADSRGWVKNGWVDYIMPQIYWNIGYNVADYTVLCNWWSDVVNGTDVKLYIGEGAYRTTSSSMAAWSGQNGTNELRTHVLNGRQNPNISGYCFFTYNDFLENSSIYALMQELHTTPADPPKGVVSVVAPSEPVPDTTVPEEPVVEEPATPEEPVVEEPAAPPVSSGSSSLSGHNTPKPIEGYKNKFTDMNDYWWAMDEINDLASRGIIRGRSETTFDPDAHITRADNTVLLLRVLNKKADFTDNFNDVLEGSYYYNEIGMAKALGIASGVGNNCFDPDAPIMRQDMATLAYRVLAEEGLLTSIPNTNILNPYSDKNDIYPYALDAMAACVDAGLMSGYGDNTINPRGNASRVEVAIFIHRIMKLLN